MVDRIVQSCVFVAAMSFSPLLRAQVTGGVWVDADVDPCMSVEDKDVCVKVEKQDVPDSPLFAFRGEAELKVELGVMAAVLLNDAIGTEWVDLMSVSEEIRRESENVKLVHQGYDLPWPVQDRDYALWEEAHFDHENRVFTLRFKSVEDSAIPVAPGFIRAEAYTTFWRLSAIPNSDLIKVEVEVFTDPKGTLPPWLVNLIQRTWPRNTIVGLYRRSIQGDIAAHPKAESW